MYNINDYRIQRHNNIRKSKGFIDRDNVKSAKKEIMACEKKKDELIIEYKMPYEDLTEITLKNANPMENIDRTIDYSIDSIGIKHTNCYYEELDIKREKEEKLYRRILESLKKHKVFRNPKPFGDYHRSADYIVDGLNETWDVKGLDGDSKTLVENTIGSACKKKQTPNLMIHKRDTKQSMKKLKDELIYVFKNNKKSYVKQVMLFDKHNKLKLYLKR